MFKCREGEQIARFLCFEWRLSTTGLYDSVLLGFNFWLFGALFYTRYSLAKAAPHRIRSISFRPWVRVFGDFIDFDTQCPVSSERHFRALDLV